MPLPLQYLAEISPSTPYFQAFIRITLMGAEWQHVWPEALQLGALTLIGLVGTRMRMRSLLREDLGLPLESPLRKWVHKILQTG